MDVAPFFVWSVLGVSLFGKGNPLRVEGFFFGLKKECGVANGTIMFVLGHLECKE